MRVRAIFLAMITRAVATTQASQLSDLTVGEDGLTIKIPEWLPRRFQLRAEPFLGVMLGGRLLCCYLQFVIAPGLLLALLRIVNSPFGRGLQAILENEFEAAVTGYRVVAYRNTSSILSARFATVVGTMLALRLRYNGSDTSLQFEMMIDVLLTVVTGGTRTMYDALVSSAVFVVAQTYLQNLFKLGSDASVDRPRLATLLSPDRWLLAAVARRAVCAFSLLLPRQRGGEVARTALVVKNTPIFQRQPRRYA